jgi:hypothetical protein
MSDLMMSKYAPLGDGDLTHEQLDGMDMWNRDVMLDERHRAVGAMLVHRAVAELRRHRAMVTQLEAWAKVLESRSPNHYEMTQHEIAAELRSRMRTP